MIACMHACIQLYCFIIVSNFTTILYVAFIIARIATDMIQIIQWALAQIHLGCFELESMNGYNIK